MWLRTFGGGTSDEYNSGKYFEIQSGYDKLNEYSNFELYGGVSFYSDFVLDIFIIKMK
ncbi:pathogenicity protein [Campylobacter jejuni]|nr:pathogenicity protein [Campylobacter jejuni]EAJ1409875.1 pathogenicity protein [Campylobacter jejuni]EAJ2751453.1 pathogenicity protein [Campylobacter jejuni]EAJ3113689.1 pathogenicity protein [Campylobacter jejuni]EAK0051545.1 pathogenicity protein [Campylobacter jejuni]